MLKGIFKAIVLLIALFVAPAAAYAQATHVLIIVGLGGDEEHGALFDKWGTKLAATVTDTLGVPKDNVTLLQDSHATRAAVVSAFGALASNATADDSVMIVLFGFGTFDGRTAKFNLPGPDMTPEDFGPLLTKIRSKRLVFVDTTSSSGPFVEALAAPGRIVVAATRSGAEEYATLFGGPFVDAFSDPAADGDHDGRVSVLEAFNYAKTQVSATFQREGLMQTEHAVLDDNGDKAPSMDPAADAKEGRAAALVSLGALNQQALPADPKLRALYVSRQDLERRIDSLKLMKSSMDPAKYEQELEALATQLALTTREIRDAGGK
ncbi:MAG: hypothetical protein ACRD1V_02340 [Vicinamibacterales bacterium]